MNQWILTKITWADVVRGKEYLNKIQDKFFIDGIYRSLSISAHSGVGVNCDQIDDFLRRILLYRNKYCQVCEDSQMLFAYEYAWAKDMMEKQKKQMALDALDLDNIKHAICEDIYNGYPISFNDHDGFIDLITSFQKKYRNVCEHTCLAYDIEHFWQDIDWKHAIMQDYD